MKSQVIYLLLNRYFHYNLALNQIIFVLNMKMFLFTQIKKALDLLTPSTLFLNHRVKHNNICFFHSFLGNITNASDGFFDIIF